MKFLASVFIAIAGLFGVDLQQLPSPTPSPTPIVEVVSVSPTPRGYTYEELMAMEVTPTPTPKPKPKPRPKPIATPIPTPLPTPLLTPMPVFQPSPLPTTTVSDSDYMQALLLLEQIKRETERLTANQYQYPSYQPSSYKYPSYDSYISNPLPTYSMPPQVDSGYSFSNTYDPLSGSYNLKYNSGGATQYGTGYHDSLTNSDSFSIGGQTTNCYTDQLTNTYNCSGR